MRTTTRTATGVGILVLMALVSVTAFVPTGVCVERGCVDECGDGEVLRDGTTEGGRGAGASVGDPFRTYDVNRDFIESENEMINHRMVWFLTIQGILFAFFLVLRGKKDNRDGNEEIIRAEENIRVKYIYIIYALGVFSAVSAGMALFLGLNTIKCIVESTPMVGRQYVIGLSHGPVPALVHYLLPWNSLPVLFVVAWHLFVEAETSRPISRTPPADADPAKREGAESSGE